MIVGFLVGAAGVIMATPWVAFVGVGIIVVGVVVGKVMQTMGYGKLSVGPVDDEFVGHAPVPEPGRRGAVIEPVPDESLGVCPAEDLEGQFGIVLDPEERVLALFRVAEGLRMDELLRLVLHQCAHPAEYPALVHGEVGNLPFRARGNGGVEARPLGGFEEQRGVVDDRVEVVGRIHARRLREPYGPVALRRARVAGSWR